MRGIIRLLWLPLAAALLLSLGCGVPIAPEAITATAVAEEEATGQVSSSGQDSRDLALSLRSTSAGAGDAAPTAIPTMPPPSPTPTATPEPAVEATEEAAFEEAAAEDEEAPPDEATTAEEGEGEEQNGENEAEGAEAELAAEPTVTPSPTTPPLTASGNEAFAKEFLALLNAQRTGRGLNALSFNALITTGASKYAAYMGTAGFFGHYGPDGSSPGSRLVEWGYRGAYAGEALSAGQGNPQAALNALLASPPHAAILLDAKAVEVGIGYALVDGSRYRHYWVVVTAIP